MNGLGVLRPNESEAFVNTADFRGPIGPASFQAVSSDVTMNK